MTSQARERERKSAPRGGGALLAVALILMALVGVVWVLASALVPAEYRKVKDHIRERDLDEAGKLVSAAVYVFHRDTGQYPRTLHELTGATGPDGYRGPYLEEIPANPGRPLAGWSYDSASGAVSDPDGKWAESSAPTGVAASESYIDDGLLPEIAGTDLWTGEDARFALMPSRTNVLYIGSDAAPSFRDDLAALSSMGGDSRAIVVVIVRSRWTSVDMRLREVAALRVPFPVIDATLDAAGIERALAVTHPPATFLCDGSGRRRARIDGKVTAEELRAAAEEVRTLRETIGLGE